MPDEEFHKLLKAADFSGGSSHKDDLKAVLKEKFAQCSCKELTDNELNHVAAALGNSDRMDIGKKDD